MGNRPFRGSAAIARGELTRNDLCRRYQRVFRDVYLANGVPLTAVGKARAAWLATGPGVTLAGTSAAALLGTKWLDAGEPAEIIRASRRPHPGIVVHSDRLDDDEVRLVAGMRVTCPARTALDIGRTRTPEEAVPILDALLNATGVQPDEMQRLVDRRGGMRGVCQFRALLPLLDGGAESPQESRLRLLVVAAGIPPPQTQIEFPALHIRVDMGWPEWRVALEYDGVQHWADARQRAWDIERIALLEAQGWAVIRVSAAMMGRPHVIVDRVRARLRQAGCPL